MPSHPFQHCIRQLLDILLFCFTIVEFLRIYFTQITRYRESSRSTLSYICPQCSKHLRFRQFWGHFQTF